MSIKVKDLFEKEINRNIKGVIKVGQCDQENIKQELEEYVVTGELNKHLDEFFKAYSKSILSDTEIHTPFLSVSLNMLKMEYGFQDFLVVVNLTF